jgi:hypothetical protein
MTARPRENYRKAFGTSPDFGAGKTEVFSGKVFSEKLKRNVREIKIWLI